MTRRTRRARAETKPPPRQWRWCARCQLHLDTAIPCAAHDAHASADDTDPAKGPAMPPRKKLPDREQLYLDGTAPPRDAEVERALGAWLDATDAAKAAAEDKRTCRDVLIARMVEAKFTIYPYLERGTGTRRIVRVVAEPTAKTARAPKAKPEKLDREPDAMGETAANRAAMGERDLRRKSPDGLLPEERNPPGAYLPPEAGAPAREAVAQAKHKPRKTRAFIKHTGHDAPIPLPAVFEPPDAPDAGDPFAATRGNMRPPASPIEQMVDDACDVFPAAYELPQTPAQLAAAAADAARERRRNGKRYPAGAP